MVIFTIVAKVRTMPIPAKNNLQRNKGKELLAEIKEIIAKIVKILNIESKTEIELTVTTSVK